MNRILLVLVVAEGLLIAVLAFMLATTPRQAAPSTEDATEDMSTGRAQESLIATGPELGAGQPEDLDPASRAPLTPSLRPDSVLSTILHGQILDQEGQPVDGASVLLRARGAERALRAGVHPERGYAIVGLDSGYWSLTCNAGGYKAFQEDLDVTGDSMQRFDIRMTRAHVVRVAFVDEDGARMAEKLIEAGLQRVGRGMSVVATLEEPPESFPMSTHRSVLRFGVGKWRSGIMNRELPERYAGELEIDVSGAVWVSAIMRQVVVGKALVQPHDEEVDLIIVMDELREKLGSLSLQIVASETGQPLDGAYVEVSDRQTGGGGLRTDESGRVKYENIIPGIVELTIRAGEDREVNHRMVSIRPGDRLDLGVVGLDPVRQAGGVVRSPGGELVGSVAFKWFRLDRTSPNTPLDNAFGARSDSDGKFELFGIGTGRYLVHATHDDGVANFVLDTSTGNAADLEVQLSEGVEVTIVNHVSRTERFLVRVTDQTGQVVQSWLEWPQPTMRERPKRFPAGRYTVEIRSDEGIVRTFELNTMSSGRRIVVPR